MKKLADKLENIKAIILKRSENMIMLPLPSQLMSENCMILSIIYPLTLPQVKTLKTASESEPSHSHPVSENSENS